MEETAPLCDRCDEQKATEECVECGGALFTGTWFAYTHKHGLLSVKISIMLIKLVCLCLTRDREGEVSTALQRVSARTP